jgi:hypothetical protein
MVDTQMLESLLTRKIPLRVTFAKSIMKLSQTHFHFGTVDNAWERRFADVTISNVSAIPLCFQIERVSKSVHSCVDLSESAMSGVIPPFDSRVFQIRFVPRTYLGKVEETLIVRNIFDRSQKDIVVKADIVIPEHFRVEVEESALDFGPCLLGQTTTAPKFMSLVNTTKKSRDLAVQVSHDHGSGWPAGYLPVFSFHIFPPEVRARGSHDYKIKH